MRCTPMRYAIASLTTLVAVVFFGLTAAGSLHERSFGLTTVPASDACALVVTDVAAAQGARMGLRAGDTIASDRLTTHERLRLMVPRSGDAMMLPAHRGSDGGAMAMVMAIPSATPSDAAYLRVTGLLVLMSLGIFVLWRGRDAASLGLGVFFAMAPAFFLSHAYAMLPDQVIVSVLFIATLLNVFGYFGLYVMVDALAAPGTPRALRSAARWAVVAALTVASWILCSSLYSRIFTGCPPLANVRAVLACYTVVIAICFALLWVGISASERSGRGRLRWILWATIVGYSGPLVSFVAIALHRPIPAGGLINLTFLAIPLGYTYAVLRHRVIDVGFVLNRALSLTILTTGIVAIFIVMESLIEHFAIGHEESMMVQLGFTLGIGMLLNSAHARLESWLERIFFRRRYALEQSLIAVAEHIDTCAEEEEMIEEVRRVLMVQLKLLDCRIILGDDAVRTQVQRDGGVTTVLPLRVHRRDYGAMILVEDEAAEVLAAEEIGLIKDLALRTSSTIAALRAEKYALQLSQADVRGK